MAGQTVDRAPTGTPGLDRVLQGGLPNGYLYLISGASGSGKTTLALQFLMEGARRGEAALYLGTSETETEIREVARSHGWDLAGIALHHLPLRQGSHRGPTQTMLHPAEVELPRTMDQVTAIVDEVEPRRLVIDSLAEIRLLAREESWFRDQIKYLRQNLADRGCTSLLTDHLDREQPILRSAVHGVVELEQLPRLYGPDRRQLRVAKMRGIAYRMGYHDLAIGTGGMEVFPHLVAAAPQGPREPRPVSTGLDELDEMLGGGLDQGASTLLVGTSGTGKSTLAAQFAVAAARRGERSALYVFDERLPSLFARSAALYHDFEEHVAAGRVAARQVDPVELTPGQFGQAVMAAVDDGVGLVVIDSLDGYGYAMPEERMLDLHMHELLSLLAGRGVTVVLVMAQPQSWAITGRSFDVSHVADTVVLLRPFEHRGEVRKAILVHKRRCGSHERTVREFLLADGRIEIGPPLTQFSGIIFGELRYLGGPLQPGDGTDR